MRGWFLQGCFKEALEDTAWNLGEDGGARPPSAFSPSGELARLRRSRSGELATWLASGDLAFGSKTEGKIES